MADITQSDVLAFAPELAAANISVTAQTAILAYVNYFDPSAFDEDDTGPTFYLARVYLAAHLETITKRGGSGAVGPLVAQSIGGVRRSYGLIAGQAGIYALGTTLYGMEFLSILQMSVAGLPMLI